MNNEASTSAVWPYFKAAVFSLLLGTLVGSCVISLVWLSVQGDLSAGRFLGHVAALSLYGLLLAVPVVFLYGVPFYALLDRLGLLSWVTVFLFGGIPGVCWVLWTHGSWVDPILINGISIAIVFHAFMRQTANKQLNARPRVRHAAH